MNYPKALLPHLNSFTDMKKILLGIATALIVASTSYATSGIFGTGVVINNNGTQTLYEATLLGDSRHNPSGFSPTLDATGFDSVDLGDFDTTTDTLALNGGGILTFKNDTDNITGASVFYSINSGGFNEIALGFNEDNVNGSGGDQRWYSQGSNIDLLDGLGIGDHTIAVYFEAPFTYTGGSGTHSISNSAANYVADFSITAVPEPGVFALLAGLFGLSFVAINRRRA